MAKESGFSGRYLSNVIASGLERKSQKQMRLLTILDLRFMTFTDLLLILTYIEQYYNKNQL